MRTPFEMVLPLICTRMQYFIVCGWALLKTRCLKLQTSFFGRARVQLTDQFQPGFFVLNLHLGAWMDSSWFIDQAHRQFHLGWIHSTRSVKIHWICMGYCMRCITKSLKQDSGFQMEFEQEKMLVVVDVPYSDCRPQPVFLTHPHILKKIVWCWCEKNPDKSPLYSQRTPIFLVLSVISPRICLGDITTS